MWWTFLDCDCALVKCQTPAFRTRPMSSQSSDNSFPYTPRFSDEYPFYSIFRAPRPASKSWQGCGALEHRSPQWTRKTGSGRACTWRNGNIGQSNLEIGSKNGRGSPNQSGFGEGLREGLSIEVGISDMEYALESWVGGLLAVVALRSSEILGR